VLGAFAAAALLLAAVGIHGLLSFVVPQPRAGDRRPRRARRAPARRPAAGPARRRRLTAAGSWLGLLLACLSARAFSRSWLGVSPYDAATLGPSRRRSPP
jgi:hypothetical protein